jgi:beta-glucosidase
MIFILIFFGLLSAQDYPFQNTSLSVDERVNNLLGLLTTDEKVGQMMNKAAAIDRLGIPYYDWSNEALHGIGMAGSATSFPQPIGLSATFDDESLLKAFTIVSDEGRAKVCILFLKFIFLKYHDSIKNNKRDEHYGVTFWTPNINIVRDSRWGRGQVLISFILFFFFCFTFFDFLSSMMSSTGDLW